jgi:hypothetical protein
MAKGNIREIYNTYRTILTSCFLFVRTGVEYKCDARGSRPGNLLPVAEVGPHLWGRGLKMSFMLISVKIMAQYL